MPILFIWTQADAYAMDATLRWGASAGPDIQGYRIYYDTDSGEPYDGTGAPEGNSPIDVGDVTEFPVHDLDDDKDYFFSIRAYNTNGLSDYSREICVLRPSKTDPYDKGWEITTLELKGFEILYNDPINPDDIPTLGPPDDIPSLELTYPNVNGVAVRCNLEPSGVYFDPPDYVKIFIPCPGYSDVSELDIYYYDDVGGWVLADDADPQWMVPGSRVNHNNGDPSTIEIQVYHFSGVQAGVIGPTPSNPTVDPGGGGCFITTLTEE